jgi:HEAT repeat protein
MKIIQYLWRRRALVAWILSIAIIITALLSPEGRLWVKGLWRREPFYRGFPPCYWAEQINNPGKRTWLLRKIIGDPYTPFQVSDPAAVPVLVCLLKHKDIHCRQFAVHALPRMTSSVENIIQPLIDAAVDSNRGVAREAATELGLMADPKDMGVIVKGLLKSEEDEKCLALFDDFIRNHAVAKANWRSDLETDPLADALDDAVQGNEPDVSRRAQKVLDKFGPNAATYTRLAKVLRHGDPQSREKAKSEFLETPLNRHRAPLFIQDRSTPIRASVDSARALSAIPGLIILLRDKDIATRRRAADAVLPLLEQGKFRIATSNAYPPVLPRAIVPVLIELARTDDFECRRKAAEAFERLGENSARAVPALIELLRSNDTITQDKAVRALYRIGQEAEAAIPALVELLKREPLKTEIKDQRMPDIRSLGFSWRGRPRTTEIGPPEALAAIGSAAIPALLEALKRPERQVRLGAAESLRMIGLPSDAAIPELISALNDADPMVGEVVAECLAMIPSRLCRDDKSIASLIKALGSKSEEVRKLAAYAFAAQDLDAHAVVLTVIDATRNKDAQLRDAAAEALRWICWNGLRLNSITQPEFMFDDEKWLSQPMKMLVSTLLAILQGGNDRYHRRRAVELLGKIGPEAKSAIPALADSLQEFALYEAAKEALAKIQAKEPSPGN